MPKLSFFTADVFTDTRFGGNPLAVVMGSEVLDSATMQAVAAEFNLSETTFVMPPTDPAHTARIRIFNRTAEMNFAGHPMVGTAFVLANQRPDLTDATFEIPAGIVRVKIERDARGTPIAATIETPQPLSVGETIAVDVVAKVLRLDPSDIITDSHPPIIASNGTPYVITELTSAALARCSPDIDAFRAALADHPPLRGPLFCPRLLQAGTQLACPHVLPAGRDVGRPRYRQCKCSPCLSVAVI